MLENLVLAVSLVVVAIGIVRFKKLTVPFKLLAVWLVVDFFLDGSNRFFIAFFKTNAALSHIETIIEYVFYAMVYYYLFKSRAIKKLVLASILLISVFFLVNAFYLQKYSHVFPTNVIMATEILYVIFAILLFKQMLQYPLQVNIIRQSIFWFNTGILFFSTTMFFNLSLMNYYSKYHKDQIAIIIYFWFTIDIVLSILFGIALLNDNKNEAEGTN